MENKRRYASLTLIDSLDTLALLGDQEHFTTSVEWIGKNHWFDIFPFLLELTSCGIGQQLAHMLLIAKPEAINCIDNGQSVMDSILDLSNAHVSAVETMLNVLKSLLPSDVLLLLWMCSTMLWDVRTLKVSQREGKLFPSDINHLVLSTVVHVLKLMAV
ncbi:hypothetical protein REPUB_Repub11eG0048300 [Reevesia pubescens]